MSRLDELRKNKGQYTLVLDEGTEEEAGKAYWAKHYTAPPKPESVLPSYGPSATDRALQEVVAKNANNNVNTNLSYEQQKDDLRAQKRQARKDKVSAAIDSILGQVTIDEERIDKAQNDYNAASQRLKDSKTALDDLKKNKWNETQKYNQSQLDENAELKSLVEMAYKAKLNADMAQTTKANLYPGNAAAAQAGLDSASIINSQAISDYNQYFKKIEEMGYDANSLLDTYTRNSNQQLTEQIEDKTGDFADKHPVLASGAHVALNAFQAPAMEDVVRTGLQSAFSHEYIPIDTNAPTFAATNVRDAISGQVTGDIQQKVIDKTENETLANTAGLLYQTGLSIGDFASAAALPLPASKAIMGTSAAVSTAKDATQRGISADKAALTAIAAGAAEIFFESRSLGNLNALKATGRSGVVNTVKDILKQTFTEGSEEVFTDIANAISDQIINGDNSAIMQNYQKLIDAGMTEEEARKQTAISFGKQIGESFLGGAISGGIIGAGGVAYGNIAQNNYYSTVGSEIKQYGNAQEVINKGLEAAPHSKTYQAAMELQERLDRAAYEGNTESPDYSILSNKKLGKLQLANENLGSQTNLINAVADSENTPLTAVAKFAAGEELSDNDVTAIKSNPDAIRAINQEYGTNLTADNISKFELNQLSDTVSKNVAYPFKRNASTESESAASYNIPATDKFGKPVDITDIEVEQGNVVVTTSDNEKINSQELNFQNRETTELFERAASYPTNAAKSFIAGYDYASQQSVTDYAIAFSDIYLDTARSKTTGGMNAETAIAMGADRNLAPQQAYLAYAAAENEFINGYNEKYMSAKNKATVKAKFEAAIKSDTVGASVIGTPKTSMQNAEIALLDEVAKHNNLSVVVVDSLQDVVGQDSNAAAVNGKIVIGLDTQNGMLLPYAGHELFHILKENKNSSATAKELQAFIIDVLKNDAAYNYSERFNELQSAYKFKGTDAEIADMINEEIAANACFTVLSKEQNFKSLVNQNKSLAQRVYDFFADFLNQIRERLVTLAKQNKEYRVLQQPQNLPAQDKIVSMMKTALSEYQKNNTVQNDSVIKLSRKINEPLHSYVEKILNMSDEQAKQLKADDTYISIMSNTPKVIIDNISDAQNLEVLMRFDSFYLETRNQGVLEGNYHNLGLQMAELPKYISDPDAIIRNDKGRLNLITAISDNNNRLISIELNTVKDINSKNTKYNLVVSVFNSKNRYVDNLIKKAVSLEYERKDLSQVNHQLHKSLATINDKSSNTTVSQTDTDVNNNSMQKIDKNNTAANSSVASTGIKFSKKMDDYSYDERKIIDGYLEAVDTEILQFYNNAINKIPQVPKINIGKVNTKMSAEILEVLGIDTSGWNIKFEDRIAKHIDKDHGKNGITDKSMSNSNDIARMKFIIENHDYYGSPATTRAYKINVNGFNKNAPTITFAKKINGTYYLVMAVPKNKTLWIVTAFMNKKIEAAQFRNASNETLRHTAVTDAASTSINTVSQTDTDVNNNSMQNNSKYSLRDSDGNELTKQQQEYFKDSKVRDENGNLLVMYHQTNADFTVFNTDNQKAGKFDSEMPTGIFLKPTENDIGLAGKKQMKVYVNITNPIVFYSRGNAVSFFEKNVPGYKVAQEEIVRIDKEYQQKYDEADLREDELYKKLFEDFKAKKISGEEFKKGVEDTETKRILNEWTKASDNARLNAKLLIDSYFSESEYDGMIVETDAGSFGRNVKSYIAFNSNQIKNTDNTNPTDNEDIRFSLRESNKDVEKLLKENAQLQDANELLRQELQLTKGHRLNPNNINSIAKSLIKKYGAYELDEQILQDSLSSLYNYMANAGSMIDDGYIWSVANDIAKNIIKVSTVRDTEFYNEYKDLKKRLRETAITVPADVRKEVAVYANINKLRIRNNGSISLDSFYNELAADYPELFDNTVLAEADQLSRIIEVYESIAPIYTDRLSQSGYTLEEYSSIVAAEIFDKYFNVKEMPTFADKKQRELEQLKLHYSNTIDDMKKEYQRRYSEREKQLQTKLKNANARNQQKLIKQQAHFTEMSLNAFHRKRRTVAKNKIANVKKDLTRRLLNPTETSFVPMSLVQKIADICDLINETQIKDKNNFDRSQNIIHELQSLHSAYEELKTYPDVDYASEYEQEMGTRISLLKNMLEQSIADSDNGTLQVAQLDYPQLEDIYHILRDIKNALVDATYQIGLDERISNHQRGIKIINELNETKGWRNTHIGRYEMETLNPVRAVRKITEYNDDAELYKMVNELNLGQRKADKFISDASKPFYDLRQQAKEFTRFSSVEVETNITDKNGTKVRMTENEIVQLIMTMKRRQGKNHLKEKGFILPDRKLLKKGKQKNALAQGTVIERLNPYEVNKMYDGLSDYAKAWMSASQYLFNEQGKNAINETSMLLKHKKIATAENYIPIQVDTDFTSKEIQGLKFDGTIEGMGSLKSVVEKANQPLIIQGLNTVVDKHINDVSKYYGLAIPIRNFNKVFGVQTSDAHDVQLGRNTVRVALRTKWGDAGLKLFDNLITDLQTSRSTGGESMASEILDKVQSNFVQATLSSNISVTIKQAASYPTALANLNGKSLGAGLPVFAYNAKQLDKLFAEIDEHTGIHFKRRIGMSSQELAELTKENAFINKIPAIINPMKWIQATDVKTTAALWVAAKYEVKKLYPDIKVNSEEYFEKVTSLYEETIENTQPNYDVLHRPEVQKEKGIMRSIAMFKTQPLQNTGILYDSLFEYRQKHSEYNKNKTDENKSALEQAQRKFRKAVNSQFWATVTFSAMSMLAAMIRHTMYGYRDDDDEVTWKSIVSGLMNSMANLFFTLLAPIGGGELYEGIKSLGDGYSSDFVSVPVVTTINDLWSSISKVVKTANGVVDGENEPKDLLSSVENLGYSVATVFGIPAKNAVNYSKGIIENIKDAVNGEFGKFENEFNLWDFKFEKRDREPKQNADRYGKYFSGDGYKKDDVKAKEILNEMISDKKEEYLAAGKTADEAEKEARSSVRDSFSSHYKKLYQDAFKKGDGNTRSQIYNILNSTGLFVYENKTLIDVIDDWEKEITQKKNKK